MTLTLTWPSYAVPIPFWGSIPRGPFVCSGGTGHAVGALFTQVIWHENPHTFGRTKKETKFNKNSFYKKKIHQEFITSKVNECFSLNLFSKTILSFGGLIYFHNKKNFNVSHYPSFHSLKTLKSPLSKLTIFFGSKLMHLTN